MTNDSTAIIDTTLDIPFGNFTTRLQLGKGDFARPYDSTYGIPKDVQYAAITVIVVIFIYIFIRVRHALDKDLGNKR
jgi:hypothetical protein